ncbi:phage portal protein family protein [Micromonosporaceae bacterium Da 78-11]
MAITTAPKRTLGFVDPYQYQSVFTDLLEHIPDLLFPTSVPVYARMRRDPQITAILSSWMLQLRRAQWQIDPAGCNPKVAARIADDLGLHVVGDDTPGAARTRGVSWNEHLRSALGMLPFGFAGFEMLADIRSGQARLAGLYERPQWTISHLHVDGSTGDLKGITQDAAWKNESPQIPAERLVWYANEREGANWAGSSLLRSCYSSWFLKEEMKRVHGISNRRWGAGVAVMKANPGSAPSTPQMMQAMELTAAMRAGETAGAAVPPDFTLDIMGLSGSVPDTLGFIKWLDQQMSRSALMGMLDLGETPNGSRALGETFVDAFLLALEAAAEHIADVATRQIAARLVDWNEGADEAVPRVVVSGVGSRRETTAESLQLLLSSGALAADPGLEAWVRREYRLPERDPDAVLVAVPGADLKKPAGEQPTDPVADPGTAVAARQADLDWGLFGTKRAAGDQLDLFDDTTADGIESVDLAKFTP